MISPVAPLTVLSPIIHATTGGAPEGLQMSEASAIYRTFHAVIARNAQGRGVRSTNTGGNGNLAPVHKLVEFRRARAI